MQVREMVTDMIDSEFYMYVTENVCEDILKRKILILPLICICSDNHVFLCRNSLVRID
jgi:hypothetical protein